MTFVDFMEPKKIFSSEEIARLRTLEHQTDGDGEWDFSLRQMLDVIGVQDDFKKIAMSSYKPFDVFPFADTTLAERGLHVWRNIFARKAHQKNGMADWMARGVYTIDDFVDEETHQAVIEEISNHPICVNKQPHNIVYQNDLPNCKNISNVIMQHVLRAIGRQNDPACQQLFRSNTFVQVWKNSPDDNDNQKNTHIDTFFPAIKYWYFGNGVQVQDGCFVYAANSPRWTTPALHWLYDESIRITQHRHNFSKLADHTQGSLRATDDELRQMGLTAQPIEVEPNTLVMANVGGFHRRGDTIIPHTRRAIHGSVRVDNPFTLF